MTAPLFLLDTEHDDAPINRSEVREGWVLTLPAGVRRHAIDAMRLADGAKLQLSDGQGLRIDALIEDSRLAQARVLGFTIEPQPVTRLCLIQALAKTGHDEQAIDMATQIGVDAIIPWQADRSIAKWKNGRTDAKWSKVLRSATEQSRRAWIPSLAGCISSKEIVAVCRRACVRGDMVIVLHQDATTNWDGVEAGVEELERRCMADGKPRTISVVIGPEGGIGAEEVEAFSDAGARICALGTNIMRASTAGPVALSLLSRILGRFR
ncbi:16S rRNA (uracil(1498)-N(3))-methyltransferase [Bifidobacterium bombi]|uniref:Ribosomal RNA small subunit methyltransferase E n=1 Tax=Bifidobacterium bombi DSM 19703 TaxID=1341695 RepID=A0A080N2P0_9BIFI|nr:16S rRNA (uracil(1498)-N(3))-methyltransferase [Bifidobacterium bombi]KFF31141.1 16S ribosomal RNA methyltransferase RsmE [Bifidobacterium bombi DSM 19703]